MRIGGSEQGTIPAPTVDIVLVVKNGAEVLPGALESLHAQTYKDFRVVAIDGRSTDGTLALLKQASRRLRMKIRSEPDRNLADGLAKGLRHAKADIVGILCADERYLPDTIERAVRRLCMRPEAVAVSGPVQFIDRTGAVTGMFEPPAFDAGQHVSCEIVWPIAGTFFNKKLIGEELRYDDSAPTCPDYELWGRLGYLYHPSRFVRQERPVASAYADSVSMSFRPEAFECMVADKQHHLRTLLTDSAPLEDRERLAAHAAAGIYVWAADQMRDLNAPSEQIAAFVARAAEIDAHDERITSFFRAVGLRWLPESRETVPMLPDAPGPALRPAGGVHFLPWAGADGLAGGDGELRTGREPWGYSYTIEAAAPEHTPGRTWVALDVEVPEGAAGFGVLSGQHLVREHVLTSREGRQTLMLPELVGGAVVVRSAGRPRSRILVHRAERFIDPDDRQAAGQAENAGE